MIKKVNLFLALCGLLLMFGTKQVFAASLILSSDAQDLKVGQVFNVSLVIDDEGTAINAVQGIVKFAPNILQAVSTDITSSEFNFWVEEPIIVNNTGSISFIGGTSKSVSGKTIKVFNAKFKAIGIGDSSISLTDSVVIADDGQGSNVLSSVKDIKVTVVGVVSIPESGTPEKIVRTPVVATNLPSAPEVEVNLYPDEGSWYNQIGDVAVFWNVPADVTAVAASIDQNPNAAPTVFEKELFNGKNFGKLNEGVWYVHVRFKNVEGRGPTTHHKISLDTTSPLPFAVKIVDGLKTDNPSPTLKFSTQDSVSGIDSYQIIIDNKSSFKNLTGEISLPIQEPGNHNIIVKAFDKAGNSTEASSALEILPIESPSIKSVTQPFFSDSDNVLTVNGSSLPNILVLLTVNNSSGVAVVRGVARADESGKWEYSFSESFKNGKYKLIAQAQDERGALSKTVEFSPLTVKSKPILKLGFLELNLWGIIIMLLAIIVVSFVGGFYFFKLKQTKIGRRVFITKQDVDKISTMAKEDIKKLKYAFQTPGEYDEDEILKHLNETIEKLDKYIQKEIDKVAK